MTEARKTDLNALMASVGHFLLEWGFLESALERGGGTAEDVPEDVRRLRNLIAHGLVYAEARPGSDREPFVRCRLGGVT